MQRLWNTSKKGCAGDVAVLRLYIKIFADGIGRRLLCLQFLLSAIDPSHAAHNSPPRQFAIYRRQKISRPLCGCDSTSALGMASSWLKRCAEELPLDPSDSSAARMRLSRVWAGWFLDVLAAATGQLNPARAAPGFLIPYFLKRCLLILFFLKQRLLIPSEPAQAPAAHRHESGTAPQISLRLKAEGSPRPGGQDVRRYRRRRKEWLLSLATFVCWAAAASKSRSAESRSRSASSSRSRDWPPESKYSCTRATSAA